jgi:hypothetical protein
VSARTQLCNTFVAKQRRVELTQQCTTVAVKEHGDEQPANEICGRLAGCVAEL